MKQTKMYSTGPPRRKKLQAEARGAVKESQVHIGKLQENGAGQGQRQDGEAEGGCATPPRIGVRPGLTWRLAEAAAAECPALGGAAWRGKGPAGAPRAGGWHQDFPGHQQLEQSAREGALL